jgi:anti-sigma-K factor RskA
MDRDTLLDLIPAYALGALDPDERAEVEAFLAADDEARKLLAEYQGLTDSLILTTPARRAPTHLNADLRQRLAASRPQATTPVEQAAPPPLKIVPRQRTRTWMPYVMAAAAILVVAIVAVLLRPKGPPDDPVQRYEWIMSHTDAQQIPITPADSNADGHLVVTADGQYGVIEVRQLPALQADQTYQLWLVDDAGAHSGGLMRFDQPQDTNYIVLPLDKPIGDYQGFGVSIEPAGGSPDPNGPSGPRVFGVSVPA